MNLFISSFRQELKIIAGLVCLLLAFELGLRHVEDGLSFYFRELPGRLSKFSDSPGKHILFLGNSLTRAGLDLEICRGQWSQGGGSAVCFELVYQNSTTVLDWHYIYKHIMGAAKEPLSLDLLVVGFARNQLDDHQPFCMDRLGWYYGGLRVIEEAFTYDIRDIGNRIDFLTCCLSKMYASRERLKNMILEAMIPRYRLSSNIINESNKKRLKQTTPKVATYDRLNRFLSNFREKSVLVIFVAMPTMEKYEIDHGLHEAIATGGGILFDLRNLDTCHNTDYIDDGFHLSPSGAAKFTSKLIEMIMRYPELLASRGLGQSN